MASRAAIRAAATAGMRMAQPERRWSSALPPVWSGWQWVLRMVATLSGATPRPPRASRVTAISAPRPLSISSGAGPGATKWLPFSQPRRTNQAPGAISSARQPWPSRVAPVMPPPSRG